MNQHKTRSIVPTEENIYVSRHAVEQFQLRVASEENAYPKIGLVIRRLKQCLIRGRRSDRDPSLLTELEPWLRNVTWQNKGRPVSVWMDETRLCCLVVKASDRENLVILTCFKAVERKRRPGDVFFPNIS